MIAIGESLNGAIFAVPSVHASIQAAHDNAGFGSGDTIHVNAATYSGNERVSWTKDGTYPAFINVISTNGQATIKGFAISSGVNLKFINFKVTHTDTANPNAFAISGTSSNIHVIDCTMTNIHTEGLHVQNTDFFFMRGCVLDYMAHPGSTQDPDAALAADNGADFSLVEYCEIHRAADMIDYYGTFHKFRNLWMSNVDVTNEWNNTGIHPDMFQPGSDGAETLTKHHDHEAIIMGNSISEHAHGFIFQDNAFHSDTNLSANGIVMYGLGGGGFGSFGIEYVQYHNFTLFNNLPTTVPPSAAGIVCNWYRTTAQAGGTFGGLFINSVIAHVGSGHDAIYVDDAIDGGTGLPHNAVLVTNHWGYVAGSESSYLGTTDPKFVNTNGLDFRLQADSPLRGIGRHLTTITNANGSGTTFGVPDKHRLKDGWGMCEGDLISFPGGATARILSIDYETHVVTVRDSITWTNNQRIYKGPLGYQADLGAYPYGATFLTAATYTKNGNVYSVTPTGDARGIWVYVDYVPTHWIYERTNSVYSVSEAGNVTAIKAYPLYAQTNSVGIVASLAQDVSGDIYRNKGRSTRSAGVIP